MNKSKQQSDVYRTKLKIILHCNVYGDLCWIINHPNEHKLTIHCNEHNGNLKVNQIPTVISNWK